MTVAMGAEAIVGALSSSLALDPEATFVGSSGRIWSGGVGELDDEG